MNNRDPACPAEFWKTEGADVVCGLCPHACRIAEGRSGRCGVRSVRSGMLVADGYGRVSSAHLDPIEKKPLYHFMPGRLVFSVGGWGCNLACAFCQNWSISQKHRLDGAVCLPDAVVDAAARDDSIGIAFTYNEPLINIEFVMQCAKRARARGLANILVTNGYINAEPADKLLALVDAINLDVKSMDESFYADHCRGTLGPVLEFAVRAIRAGCHLEVTNLLIPGLNDAEAQVRSLSQWMRKNLGETTPLHLSAYHPDYRFDRPATSVIALERAFAAASADLAYVYIGNANIGQGRDTLCRGCGKVLVRRSGFDSGLCGLTLEGVCAECGCKADFQMSLHAMN